MKIIIVGCGKIGSTILRSLVNEGHEVVGIDNDPAVISDISTIFDAMFVEGNGADSDALLEAGVRDCELLAAVTASDELNMLCCYLAKKMGAKHTIARIRTPEYNDRSLSFMRQHLEISMAINPDLQAAEEIFNMLKLPEAATIESFSRRSFEMIELRLKPDSRLDGMSLIDVRKQYDAKFLVCTVQRDEQMFIPGGHFVLKSGDKISITAENAEAQKLFRQLGLTSKRAKNAIILGASRISYYLAKMLLFHGFSVKIIEKDRERCEQFSALLPKAIMICGDGAKQELLIEEGVRDVDAFIALTGMDEQNILISFYVASLNVPKVISKVNKQELSNIAETLGIDSIVSPQKIVSETLSRYARALENSLGSSVETLYKIHDGKAEALEFIVEPEFKYCGIPLKDMKIKPNILVAGIIRDRSTVIPGGNDRIHPGDRVVIIAEGAKLVNLSDIVSGQ